MTKHSNHTMTQTNSNVKLESFPAETAITNQKYTKISIQVSCITTNTIGTPSIISESKYV